MSFDRSIDPVFDFLTAPPLRLIASNQASSGSRLIKYQTPTSEAW